VQIGSATIIIDSRKNFVIALQNVAIDSYTAADASLALSPTGASLRGNLVGDISVMGITIKHAYLLLHFHKAGSRNETEVMLGGKVVWEGYTINAGMHIYPSEGRKKVCSIPSTDQYLVWLCFPILSMQLKGQLVRFYHFGSFICYGFKRRPSHV
jgi:hypothetical protein